VRQKCSGQAVSMLIKLLRTLDLSEGSRVHRVRSVVASTCSGWLLIGRCGKTVLAVTVLVVMWHCRRCMDGQSLFCSTAARFMPWILLAFTRVVPSGRKET